MIKKLVLGFLIFLVLVGAGFIAWASSTLGPSSDSLAALNNGDGVSVELNSGWTIFRPTSTQPNTGFIFYPGGRVDYRSYAPLLRMIASRGYLVVEVPMPLNLAIFGVGKALDVIKGFPQIRSWAVGGHSLGGSMAAQFAADHRGAVQGLVLWASYPPTSLANRFDLKILSISASNDGLATPTDIQASKKLFPETTTRYALIQGGNHGQFGSYGSQPGDNPATISPAAQWQQVVDATEQLLRDIEVK